MNATPDHNAMTVPIVEWASFVEKTKIKAFPGPKVVKFRAKQARHIRAKEIAKQSRRKNRK